MSEDFLKNPLSLFDVTRQDRDRHRRVGRVRRARRQGAGRRRRQCRARRRQRRRAEEGRRRMRGARRQGRSDRQARRARRRTATRSSRPRSSASAGVDILVVASGRTRSPRSSIRRPRLPRRHGRQRHAVLADGARRRPADAGKQGRGGKVMLMSSARGLLGHPAGYTAYCASKSAIDGITKALGCEWGATGITVNAHRADGLPLAADRLDVRGQRDARKTCARASSRACRRAASASRTISPARCCSSPRKASDFYTGHILYADGGYTAG